MKERITCRIDETLKDDYYTYISTMYGEKHRKTGFELEKVVKLQLALSGHDSYQDDPDVQAMLRLSAEKYSSTHTSSQR